MVVVFFGFLFFRPIVCFMNYEDGLLTRFRKKQTNFVIVFFLLALLFSFMNSKKLCTKPEYVSHEWNLKYIPLECLQL